MGEIEVTTSREFEWENQITIRRWKWWPSANKDQKEA